MDTKEDSSGRSGGLHRSDIALRHLDLQVRLQGDPSRWPKPPVDFKTEVPFRLGLARPKQTFFLKSTGGFGQHDGVTLYYSYQQLKSCRNNHKQ